MYNMYPPPWMPQQPSILEQIDALEKYKEELIRRHEEEKKKKKEPPKKDKQGLGFFEGLVVAYIAQVLYGPLTKLIAVYLAAHGVQ